MASRSGSSSNTIVSFRESFIKALDEGRLDDLALLLANEMRLRQEVMSPLARASLPVDASKASPLRGTKLTRDEIAAYDIRDKGWHLVAIKDDNIVGAERFDIPSDDPKFKAHVQNYTNAVHSYYGEDAIVFAAYHAYGLLVEWLFLSDFTAAPRKY